MMFSASSTKDWYPYYLYYRNNKHLGGDWDERYLPNDLHQTAAMCLRKLSMGGSSPLKPKAMKWTYPNLSSLTNSQLNQNDWECLERNQQSQLCVSPWVGETTAGKPGEPWSPSLLSQPWIKTSCGPTSPKKLDPNRNLKNWNLKIQLNII